MAWTDERIDQLKSLWEKGLTASQIAEELGGVSRNAVIGKAHRLGLKSRPSPVKSGDSKKKAAPKKVVKAAEAPPKPRTGSGTGSATPPPPPLRAPPDEFASLGCCWRGHAGQVRRLHAAHRFHRPGRFHAPRPRRSTAPHSAGTAAPFGSG